MNNDLPSHSSAVEEKLERQHRRNHSTWTRPVFVSIPGVRSRRLRIFVPNTTTLNHQLRVARMVKRKRGPLFVALACLAVFFTVVVVSKGVGHGNWQRNEWEEPPQEVEPPTLVFQREDLRRIWSWEIASGHYPSTQSIPLEIGLKETLPNPALPPQHKPPIKPSRFQSPATYGIVTDTRGSGSARVYLDIQSQPPNVAYPPRPVPGSVADLDHIMKHCDFSTGKYVRDCLEMLRLGGGLDNGERIRRDSSTRDWRYIYIENGDNSTSGTTVSHHGYDAPRGAGSGVGGQDPLHNRNKPNNAGGGITAPAGAGGMVRPGVGIGTKEDPNEGLLKMPGVEWEPPLRLSPPLVHRPANTLPSPCDPENPRVFHMFWTGPFTDKPYLAILSFLFSQNTGIHLKEWPADATVCRPQFWLWINPGPAASVPNPTAVQDMFEQLKQNPWAAPFLHPRFREVLQFKLWNTTEQLDSIPEIKDEWRGLSDRLFNSGGHIMKVKNKPVVVSESTTSSSSSTAAAESAGAGSGSDGGLNATTTTTASASSSDEDDLENRTGSKSSSSYDRLSVILSDMARFVLCHRFGGVYLDADTILLRDWEELWGWKGAFAYRWSRLEKYNTAVLRMNRGSALGSFLFRTALKNGLDFHPMTVSKYTADAYVEPLLLRLPDALFDAAWLNTEDYQRDRPPQPFFTEFKDFFDTPVQNSASPHALGFRGFFRGSYSYHFHNFWWKPFDPARNFPDLGPRFKATEDIAHATLRKAKIKSVLAAQAAAAAAASSAAEAQKSKPNAPPSPPPVFDPSSPPPSSSTKSNIPTLDSVDDPEPDKTDLDWSTVLKRTFEAYIRGERPNMYGEWIQW